MLGSRLGNYHGSVTSGLVEGLVACCHVTEDGANVEDMQCDTCLLGRCVLCQFCGRLQAVILSVGKLQSCLDAPGNLWLAPGLSRDVLESSHSRGRGGRYVYFFWGKYPQTTTAASCSSFLYLQLPSSSPPYTHIRHACLLKNRTASGGGEAAHRQERRSSCLRMVANTNGPSSEFSQPLRGKLMDMILTTV